MLLWERLQLEAHVREQQMYYKKVKRFILSVVPQWKREEGNNFKNRYVELIRSTDIKIMKLEMF